MDETKVCYRCDTELELIYFNDINCISAKKRNECMICQSMVLVEGRKLRATEREYSNQGYYLSLRNKYAPYSKPNACTKKIRDNKEKEIKDFKKFCQTCGRLVEKPIICTLKLKDKEEYEVKVSCRSCFLNFKNSLKKAYLIEDTLT